MILSELDFPTDGHVWLAWAAKTGAEIVWLRSADGLTIPLEIPASESTRKYLKTKKDKLGHRLSSV